ncbi:MAG TPA: aminotransferase class V-fold PLP-dependent enzyme [Solirubrobacteraceae bacterium]|nr:aminotransferase class V-fold PLP-dependent enzyme [Solirubrobacteraceae bacterium]
MTRTLSPISLDVRADFPIFGRRFDGRPLVYLDSGATSQKPAIVIDALAEHLRAHNANVHRGVYALAQEADAAYDGARRRVAAFVSASPQTRCSRRTSPRRSTSSPTPGGAARPAVARTWDRATRC